MIEIFYRHNQGISYNFIWVFHGWPEPRCNRKLDWQAHAAIDPRPSDVRCSFPSGSLTCCITTPPQTFWSSRHYPKADRNKPQVLQANDKAAFRLFHFILSYSQGIQILKQTKITSILSLFSFILLNISLVICFSSTLFLFLTLVHRDYC